MPVLSPLQILHEHIFGVAQKGGVALPPEAVRFGFDYSFPVIDHPVVPAVKVRMEIEWEEEKCLLNTYTLALSLESFPPFIGMEKYFSSVTRNLLPFLPDEWPGGELIPFDLIDQMTRMNCISHCMGAELPVNVDAGALVHRFEEIRDALCKVFLLCRPLIAILSQAERVPSLLEQVRLFAIESGKYELYYGDMKLSAYLPRGWYNHRYRPSPRPN